MGTQSMCGVISGLKMSEMGMGLELLGSKTILLM